MSILAFGLRYILRFFMVQKVQIITQNFRALPILKVVNFFLCHLNLL